MTYQAELYAAASPFPVAADDLESSALARMTPEMRAYVGTGAGNGLAVAANRAALNRWTLVPRVLTGTTNADTEAEVELLGHRVPPVLPAPMGILPLLYPHGDLAMAEAARRTGCVPCVSTLAGHPLEAVAEQAGDGPAWFQLYWPTNRRLARSFLERAEHAGYAAIVVTLDTPLVGWRPWDLTHACLPPLDGIGLENYESDPVFAQLLGHSPRDDPEGTRRLWQEVFDGGHTWHELGWLTRHTTLPVLVKGVLHPHDAQLAVDVGAAGIIVSNHGGRHLDRNIAALDALPAVVDAVDLDVPVLMDSGIRSGTDVLIALALGARAVLLGRPLAYGLTLGGVHGAVHVLRCVLDELQISMAIAGVRSVKDVSGIVEPSAGWAVPT